MLLLILLGIFTAFLSLAFALLHLMASLSELRKHKNTLGNRLLLIGSNLATFSHPLFMILNILLFFKHFDLFLAVIH
ncbi:hypothetical protein EFM52_04285 [Streptococcus thermophilus]|nr:hypothetical protein [Streptococcus thermophilus]